MEQLGTDLQLQVKKLVVDLRAITKRERQLLIDRVHEDYSRVRDDMNQTQNIQQYLISLLAETDPFLLIWVIDTLLYTISADNLGSWLVNKFTTTLLTMSQSQR